LYNLLRSTTHDIGKLVEEKKRVINRDENGENDGDIDQGEETSVPEGNNSILLPDPSLPLPPRPNTLTNQANNVDEKRKTKSIDGELSIYFTINEWKDVVSNSGRRMKDDWTKVFSDKLESNGIKYVLKFKTSYFKGGERKRNCTFFGCHAKCTIDMCERRYQMILFEVR
jgi:hypothetical protein